MTPFERALAFALKWEGGFVDHPADKGGATNQGITQKTYDIWRQNHREPLRSVRLIERAEVELIYYENYWRAGKCEEMPAPVSLVHFDACVNHGPGLAAKLLQRAAGVAPDGRIGPVTLGAVARANPGALALGYIEERRAFYRGIVARDPSQRVFEQGWLNRLASLQAEVMK